MLMTALAAIGGAMVLLFIAFRTAEGTELNTETRRILLALAVATAALLVLALFCVGLLLIRFLVFRLKAPPAASGPTEYVNAWEEAGKRLKLPDEEDDEADDEWG